MAESHISNQERLRDQLLKLPEATSDFNFARGSSLKKEVPHNAEPKRKNDTSKFSRGRTITAVSKILKKRLISDVSKCYG